MSGKCKSFNAYAARTSSMKRIRQDSDCGRLQAETIRRLLVERERLRNELKLSRAKNVRKLDIGEQMTELCDLIYQLQEENTELRNRLEIFSNCPEELMYRQNRDRGETPSTSEKEIRQIIERYQRKRLGDFDSSYSSSSTKSSNFSLMDFPALDDKSVASSALASTSGSISTSSFTNSNSLRIDSSYESITSLISNISTAYATHPDDELLGDETALKFSQIYEQAMDQVITDLKLNDMYARHPRNSFPFPRKLGVVKVKKGSIFTSWSSSLMELSFKYCCLSFYNVKEVKISEISSDRNLMSMDVFKGGLVRNMSLKGVECVVVEKDIFLRIQTDCEELVIKVEDKKDLMEWKVFIEKFLQILEK